MPTNYSSIVSLRILKTGVTLLFWASLLLISVIVIKEGKDFLLGDYHFFALENVDLHVANPNDRTTIRRAGELIHINPARVSISFAYDDPAAFDHVKWLYFATTLPLLLMGIALVWLLWNLKQVVDTIGTATVFSQQNVRRVRMIGLCIISVYFLEKIPWWFGQSYVSDLLNKESIAFSANHTTSILNGWMLGLLIIALAEVFRQGVVLKQENELTI